MQRRSFLQGMGLAALSAASGVSFAAAGSGDARLCLVVLRGGLDGLAAIPAVGDPAFAKARGSAAPVAPCLTLDGTFALHPSLEGLRPLWDRKELLVVHAVASPYAERSHFDAQDVLENGTSEPYGLGSGWLNRALQARGDTTFGLAAGNAVPLVLRGTATVASADPERAPRVPTALMASAGVLYANDRLFGPALTQGQHIEAILAGHRTGASHPAVVIGRTLADPAGPRVAVMSMGGWDTHTTQDRTLDGLLTELTELVNGLKTGTGETWGRTVVAVVTEFGRTVAGNGTGGTDHGVGGMALLAGGAVAGGRVLCDWPGLAAADLLEGRDLRATTDLRALFKGIVGDHLQVASAAVERDVFPRSGGARALAGLFRA